LSKIPDIGNFLSSPACDSENVGKNKALDPDKTFDTGTQFCMILW
jgi:hypothetical protein